MSDVQEIQSTIARVSHHIDGKRWPELRALYADEVATDYTSLFGGEPQKQRGDELIAGWKKLLGEITTQHLLGPVDVTLADGSATAECHVRAMHRAGAREWIVGGHYVFELTRSDGAWRITRMVLETYYEQGDRGILQA